MTRLSKISKEKIRKTKIVAARSLVAILCVFFGILIAAQWRSIPNRVTNPVAPYISLKETKDQLYDEQSLLKTEISSLQNSIDQIQEDSENIALTKSEIADLKNKKALAGLTKLNGPGIIVTLDDSKSGPASENAIVHAADLRDITNILWGSGAEAVSINDQRIVINSAVDCIVNLVLVNNVRISTPFKIEAIGSQQRMVDAVSNQSLLSNLYERKRNQGVIFTVVKNNDITVPAFDGSFEIKTGGVN